MSPTDIIISQVRRPKSGEQTEGLFGHDRGVTEGFFVPFGVSGDLLRSWDLRQSPQRVEKRRLSEFQVATRPPGTPTMGA